MRSLMLVLRGLWWRRGLTAAVLAVAVVTTTAAALGPFYARAAGESTLTDHLRQAEWRTGLHFSGTKNIAHTDSSWTSLRDSVPEAGQLHGYNKRIEDITSALPVQAAAAKGHPLSTNLTWRSGQCAHLVLVSGHCPTKPGEAVLSARSFVPNSDAQVWLGSEAWKVGTKLRVGGFGNPDYAPYGFGDRSTVAVTIVGLYRPRNTDDPFWFGNTFFDQHPGNLNPEGPPHLDTLFVTRATMLSIGDPSYVTVDFDFPLTPTAVRLNNEGAERALVANLLHHQNVHTPLAATSGLGVVLKAADSERDLVDVGTLLVILQLGLLAWLVLFQVVADAIEARGNEIAMAKLRGHSARAAIRFGLSEPLVLLAAAIPIGLLAAWGLTHAFTSSLLARDTPVHTTWAPVLAALAAFAGGLLAAAFAGYTTLTRSVLDQWRRTNRRPGHGWAAIAADVLLAGAAIAGLIALRQNHRPRDTNDSAALLTPGLLVFAVALIGVRLLPPACRWLAKRTRASRQVGTFLATRQVSRRPVGLRLAALLAVAVGLATFAVAGESVATGNRHARAAAELGAPRVASVQYVAGHDPVLATKRADPDGRWAMAAATWAPFGGGSVTGPVVGVDTTRLAAVGEPIAGGPGPDLLAKLAGGAPVPPVKTKAQQIRVHLTASGLTGDKPPTLVVNLQVPRNPYLNAQGPSIHDGAATYTVPLECADVCTLRGLRWDRPVTAVEPTSGTIVLTGIDLSTATGWQPVPLYTGVKGAWRSAVRQGQATDRVTLSKAGVTDHFTNRNGGYGGISYGSDPSPIPAVATPSAIPHQPTRGKIIDGLNISTPYRVVRYEPLVPIELSDGVLMDVRYLQNQLPAFANDAEWQVWIGADAPADAVQQLRQAGLLVQSVSSMANREAELRRQGPALALLLLLACAVAGAALAVGGTAISISASSRRRSYEIAALRAVGVSRRSLMRASVLEQLLLLGTGVLLGVPTGLIAARLAMPVIPEFADATPITLDYTPRALPTLIFAGAFVVLLSLTALVAARALIKIAVPGRLREAEA